MPEEQLARKTALVTGANTGLGFDQARALAASGYATQLACRHLSKAQQACERILAEHPRAKVEAVVIDLSDLSSVRAFGRKAQEAGQPLDVLCNNAGVWRCPEGRTADGFETQIGVNHMGHFLLTCLLLPLMTADPARPARIVNVSSRAHHFASIDYSDLHFERRPYDRRIAYANSKLCNILFTIELARRLPPHVTANSLHPGIIPTDIVRHVLGGISNLPCWKALLLSLARLFLRTPQQGAATQIYLCTSPEVAQTTGKYFVDCREASTSAAAQSKEDARRLWEVSLEAVGIEDPLP